MKALLVLMLLMVCESLATPYIDSYPCNGSHIVRERFVQSDQPVYKLSILPKHFLLFPTLYDLDIKFNISANITREYEPAISYSDGLSCRDRIIDHDRNDKTLIIHPYEGRQFPYFTSIKINDQEICPFRTNEGIFEEFLLAEPTTLPPVEQPQLVPPASPQTLVWGECGRRQPRPPALVVGGRSTLPGAWPWHAALYRLHQPGRLDYICGGTLLTSTRVLTAAHCVMENGAVLVPERLFVALGKFQFIGGEVGVQEKAVFEIILHPEFSRPSLSNDLAMLMLSTQAELGEFVQPICLWKRRHHPPALETGYTAGWGRTENDSVASHLMEAEMPIVSDLTCIKSNPVFYTTFLKEKTFCAGFANGTSVCNGDSGGGLYVPRTAHDGEQIWFLRGVVSLGVPEHNSVSCDSTQYVIFSDAALQADFINASLWK